MKYKLKSITQGGRTTTKFYSRWGHPFMEFMRIKRPFLGIAKFGSRKRNIKLKSRYR